MLFQAANREDRVQNSIKRPGWVAPTESFEINCRDPSLPLDLAYIVEHHPAGPPVAFPAPAAAVEPAARPEWHAAAGKEPTGKSHLCFGAGTGDAVQQERLDGAARQAGDPAAAEFSREIPAPVSVGQTPVASAPPAAAGRCGGLSHCAAGSGNSAGAATVAVQTAGTFLLNTGVGKRAAGREPEHRLGSSGSSPCGSAPISGPSGGPSGGAHHAASCESRPEAARSSEPECGE